MSVLTFTDLFGTENAPSEYSMICVGWESGKCHSLAEDCCAPHGEEFSCEGTLEPVWLRTGCWGYNEGAYACVDLEEKVFYTGCLAPYNFLEERHSNPPVPRMEFVGSLENTEKKRDFLSIKACNDRCKATFRTPAFPTNQMEYDALRHSFQYEKTLHHDGDDTAAFWLGIYGKAALTGSNELSIRGDSDPHLDYHENEPDNSKDCASEERCVVSSGEGMADWQCDNTLDDGKLDGDWNLYCACMEGSSSAIYNDYEETLLSTSPGDKTTGECIEDLIGLIVGIVFFSIILCCCCCCCCYFGQKKRKELAAAGNGATVSNNAVISAPPQPVPQQGGMYNAYASPAAMPAHVYPTAQVVTSTPSYDMTTGKPIVEMVQVQPAHVQLGASGAQFGSGAQYSSAGNYGGGNYSS